MPGPGRFARWHFIAASTCVMLNALAQDSPAGHLPPSLIEQTSRAVDADAARLTAIYKDIHRNPELGFMETRTSGIVAKELKALGFDVKTGIGKTGVVGVLNPSAKASRACTACRKTRCPWSP